MRKEVREIIALPFEVGKTYKTKFATGEKFKVTDIKIGKTGINKGKVVEFEGVYESHQHLGSCPLSADRLIPEYEEGENFEICDKCKETLNKEDERKQHR